MSSFEMTNTNQRHFANNHTLIPKEDIIYIYMNKSMQYVENTKYKIIYLLTKILVPTFERVRYPPTFQNL